MLNLTGVFMNKAKVINLVLTVLSLLVAQPGFAGRDGGGAIYAKVDGKWVLLDELEASRELDVTQLPAFSKVNAVLQAVAQEIPSFAKAMSLTLTKTWHRVPFELKCESADTPVDVQVVNAACQEEHDVWVSEAFLDREDTYRLITHELIQGIRLARGKNSISAFSVRTINMSITSEPFPSAETLAEKIKRYKMGAYMTRKEENQIQNERQAYLNELCKPGWEGVDGLDSFKIYGRFHDKWCSNAADGRFTPGLQDGYWRLLVRDYSLRPEFSGPASICSKFVMGSK